MAEQGKGVPKIPCEELFFLSLREVSSSFGISRETVIEIIDEGIVSAQRDEKEEWRFDSEALRRIRTTLQLTQDLGINLAGAGLALDLLNEIEHLHALLHDKE